MSMRSRASRVLGEWRRRRLERDHRLRAAASDWTASVSRSHEPFEPLEARLLLDGAPYVEALRINEGLGQRSDLQQIEVLFSEDVSASLSYDDLSIIDKATGLELDLSGGTVSWDTGTNAATWLLGSLADSTIPDGFLQVGLDADGIQDGGGAFLDGNRDGIGGDDFTFGTHRLHGDTDGNGRVDAADLDRVKANWLLAVGQADLSADLNHDDVVDGRDMLIVRRNWHAELNAAVPLTQATSASEVAEALHYHPERMYEYILNTVQYVAYDGSMKGGPGVLATGRANAYDQSALLAALLTEAGIHARYSFAQVQADIW